MAERVRSKKDKSIYIQVCYSYLLSEIEYDYSECNKDKMLWYVIEEIPKGKEANNRSSRNTSGSKRRREYYEEEEEEVIVKELGRKDRIRLLSSVPPLPHTFGRGLCCAKIMALNSRIYILGGMSTHFLGVVPPGGPDQGNPRYNDVLYFDTRCPENGWKRGPSFNIPRHAAYPVLLQDGEGKVKKIFAMGYIWNNNLQVIKSQGCSSVPGNLDAFDLDSSDPDPKYSLESWAEVLDVDSSDAWKPLTGFPSWIYEVAHVKMHAIYDNGKKILLYSSSCEAFVYDLEQNSWSLISQDFGRWIAGGAVAYGYLFAYGRMYDSSDPYSLYACHLPTTTWLPIPVKGLRKDGLELPSREHDLIGNSNSTTKLLCINHNTFALVWSRRVWGRYDVNIKSTRFVINCTKFTIHKRKKYSNGKLEYHFRAHVLSTGYRTVRGSLLTDCVAL